MIVAPLKAQVAMTESVVRRLMVLRLYTNDVSPTEYDDIDKYEEMTGGGYAPIELPPDLWVVQQGPPIAALYPERGWRFTQAAGVVHGYFLTWSGTLWWAERLERPFAVDNTGDVLRISLRYEYRARRSTT